MKVNPPSPGPYDRDQEALAEPEGGEYLGLQGQLKAFESTPLIPLIKTALQQAGINPAQYSLEQSGHYNYYGLPATEPSATERGTTASPIVDALGEGVQSGEIETRPIKMNTVDFVNPALYPSLLTKLTPINVNALVATATGETLAYSAPMDSDGGRPGYVILSANQVAAINNPS